MQRTCSVAPANSTTQRARMKLCVLHIGSEKTGTTSIQKYLAANRNVLLKQGYWYPKFGSDPGEGVHLGLSTAGLKRTLGKSRAEAPAGFREEYEAAAAGGASTGIISAEFFHSQYRNGSDVAYIADFLARFFDRVRVIYYARRQDGLAVSMHSTAIKGGWTAAEHALNTYSSKGHYYFDHLAICNLWASRFGAQNLLCRVYEPERLVGGDVVADFEAITGVSREGMQPPARSNESLSFRCLSALARLNRSVHKDNQKFRAKLLHLDRVLGPAPKIPAMTRAEAAEFIARFEEINREFFARYIDPNLATGFKPGVDSYPEVLPKMAPQELLDFVFSVPVKGSSPPPGRK